MIYAQSQARALSKAGPGQCYYMYSQDSTVLSSMHVSYKPTLACKNCNSSPVHRICDEAVCLCLNRQPPCAGKARSEIFSGQH